MGLCAGAPTPCWPAASPSPNGLGYPRIPRLFHTAQVDAWRATTSAVHDRGGKIKGRNRVGIRLSPCGLFNGTGEFPDVQAQYLALAESLSALGLLYIHLVDHSATGRRRCLPTSS